MNIVNKKGFSLIEVLVALVVVAGGIAGATKLQGIFFQNSSDAQSRSVATSLAQRKLDDLRSFVEIVPSTGKTWEEAVANPSTINMAYQFITVNKGGLIQSGAQNIIQNSNSAYSLSWTAQDHWYYDDDTDPSTVKIDVTSGAGAVGISDYKVIITTVTWADQKGENQSIELETNISATMANGSSKLAIGVAAGGSFGGPDVKYTNTSFPDVLPVNITDDLNKATSLPAPEVSKKAGSTLVRFDSITYKDGTNIEVRREDFLSVSCQCSVGSGGKYPVGVTTWDDSTKALLHKKGSWVVGPVAVGVDNPINGETQPYCDVCCRDHYDAIIHPGSSGEEYVDACRLKRIDGEISVIEDWKLIAVNIIPNSFFADENNAPIEASLTAYSTYVKDLVRTRLPSSGTVIEKAKFAFSEIDTSFSAYVGTATSYSVSPSTQIQLSARAVYLDLPPDSIYEEGTYDRDSVPLDRIPFYDENVTMLAGWVPDADNSTFSDDYVNLHDDGVYILGKNDDGSYDLASRPGYSIPSTNWVTNELLIDPPTYSRGLFFANVLGPTTVKTRLKNGSFGQVNIAATPNYLHLGSSDIDNNSLVNNILLPTNFTSPAVFPVDSSISSGDEELIINVE